MSQDDQGDKEDGAGDRAYGSVVVEKDVGPAIVSENDENSDGSVEERIKVRVWNSVNSRDVSIPLLKV